MQVEIEYQNTPNQNCVSAERKVKQCHDTNSKLSSCTSAPFCSLLSITGCRTFHTTLEDWVLRFGALQLNIEEKYRICSPTGIQPGFSWYKASTLPPNKPENEPVQFFVLCGNIFV